MDTLRQSLQLLRASSDREKVVLWLGRKNDDFYQVEQVFVPIQVTDRDYFEIPPKGMADIMQVLRQLRLMIVAQVHTHPAEAFHSAADDRWAIIRHFNAYSIVVPDFAQHITVQNFASLAAVFVLNQENKWKQENPLMINIYEL